MISIVAYSSSGLPSTIRDAIAKRADMSLVREATGHHEALNLVKYLRPAILLFSADAPNQDSRAIRFMLRSRVKRGTRGVAIVNSEDDALRAIRLGCSGTVTADATAEAVVECLNKVHDGETWLDPLTSMVLVRQIVYRETKTMREGMPGPIRPRRPRSPACSVKLFWRWERWLDAPGERKRPAGRRAGC